MGLGSPSTSGLQGELRLARRRERWQCDIVAFDAGDELTITLIPAVPPGEQVNIVFKSFNPNEGIYQWATRLIPVGSDSLASEGPTLRLHVYRSDFIR